MEFPVTLPFLGVDLHPHLVLETAGYAVGSWLYRRARRTRGDFLSASDRWSTIVAVVLGAVVGSKLLHHLASPSTWRDLAERPALLLGGKTIVGGLLGGWLAVEIVKKALGIRRRTGDLYAVPLAVGIAIGRIGCFLTGLDDRTYGVATALPWGVDFGDGVRRHPTQLYEIVFLLGLVAALHVAAPNRRQGTRFRAFRFEGTRFRAFLVEGTRFRTFLAGYLAFRLVVDAWKPYERVAFGLQGIQLACLAGLAALAVGAVREPARAPDPAPLPSASRRP